MPTLRRILKYMPAVVLGLLVVAWVVTIWLDVGIDLPNGMQVGLSRGSAYWVAFFMQSTPPRPWFHWEARIENSLPVGYFGYLRELVIELPLAWPITAVLPLALGPFLAFRLRLWHYLAYTALVAVELAYYLRWQE